MILVSKKSFKILNWKLLIVIFLTLAIPAFYEITRVYFVGDVKNTYSFSIAGNLNWINVIFEVLEEAFLLPLFFSISKISKSNNINKKIMGQFYAISLIYFIVIIFSLIFTSQLLSIMSVKNVDSETTSFIRLELITRFFIMGFKITTLFLIAKNMWKQIILILVVKFMTNFLFDTFIVGDNTLSLKKGIQWIAIDQLITNIIIMIIGTVFLAHIYKIKWHDVLNPSIFKKSIPWKQFLWSGGESLIRNSFFIFFVIKTINKLPGQFNQGDYWVMNNFIWNFLLIPILAISQYVNRDHAFRTTKTSLAERILAPIILVAIIIIIWLITIPSWGGFIRIVLNNPNYQNIKNLALISIGFYILFAYNVLIDKIFLGHGKSEYLFFQSLITNIVVYIPYYHLGNINNLQDIAIMMGIAITVDSLLTFAIFGRTLKKLLLK